MTVEQRVILAGTVLIVFAECPGSLMAGLDVCFLMVRSIIITLTVFLPIAVVIGLAATTVTKL